MKRIFNKQKAATLKKAVSCFGTLPQLIVALEECSELQKEITKYLRGKRCPDDIAEEIADVLIMIGQLQVIYPDVSDTLINTFITKKLGRIEGLCYETEVRGFEDIVCLNDRY